MEDVDDGTLVVVTGPPGVGKSTVARLLAAGFPRSAVVRGDEFFEFLAEGYVDPWLPESHEQNQVVVAAAASATARFVRGGYTVAYDGVIGPWFVEDFAAACEVATLHYAILMPPEEVAVERVRTRIGHGFTDLGAARQMYAEFHDADIARRHVLQTGDADAAAVADVVRRELDAGRLAWP